MNIGEMLKTGHPAIWVSLIIGFIVAGITSKLVDTYLSSKNKLLKNIYNFLVPFSGVISIILVLKLWPTE